MGLEEDYMYLRQELNNIDSLIQEQIKERDLNETLLNDVDSINSLKENSELIVPISKGIFARLIVKEFKGFVVNVGNNILVEKDLKGIKDLLNDNIKIIEENLNALREQRQKLSSLLNQIVEKINRLQENSNSQNK